MPPTQSAPALSSSRPYLARQSPKSGPRCLLGNAQCSLQSSTQLQQTAQPGVKPTAVKPNQSPLAPVSLLSTCCTPPSLGEPLLPFGTTHVACPCPAQRSQLGFLAPTPKSPLPAAKTPCPSGCTSAASLDRSQSRLCYTPKPTKLPPPAAAQVVNLIVI